MPISIKSNFHEMKSCLTANSIELDHLKDWKDGERIRDQTLTVFKKCEGKHSKSWDQLKWKAYELSESASQKINLLENRQKLYGSTELPSVDNFNLTLKHIAKTYPDLKIHCKHFKKTLACCMRIQLQDLSLEAIDQLEKFSQILAAKPEFSRQGLHQAVKRLITYLKQTLASKKSLLQQLSQWAQKNQLLDKPFFTWNDKDKLTLIVKAEQILKNPFEARFKSSDLFRMMKAHKRLHKLADLITTLENENTATKDRKDFWDNLSELERKAHRLANTQEKRKWLLKCKTEGLKAYMALQPRQANGTHLIVGAGPAGLIRAIYLSMKHQDFQMIEKRSINKIPRQNTVTLGKWDPKEIEILSFLGTLALLEKKISFGHNRPYYIEVALGDLEKALETTLHSIREAKNSIEYDTEIQSIDKDSNGNAVLKLINHKNPEKNRSISPQAALINDGASGTTKQLLGISRINLAKPTFLAFSIFKKTVHSTKTIASTIKYRVVNVLKGCLLAIKMLFFAIIHGKTLEQAYSLVMIDGPSGLSRIPSHDYLLRIFRKKEHKMLKKSRSEIQLLNSQIKYQLAQKHNASQLQTQKEKLERKFLTALENKAQTIHGMLDFMHSVFNPRGHRMKALPMNHEKTFVVDVMVSKAEQPIVRLGQTQFHLRGDACHTTDPFSGTGCKTAIEELLADQYFLSHSNLPTVSNMEMSILNWGQNHYQQKMIDKAFEERLDYYLGTEKPERFADLALQKGVINSEEYHTYIQSVELRKENHMPQGILEKLQSKLRHVLKKRGIDEKNPRWNERKCLSSKTERRLIEEGLKSAFKTPIMRPHSYKKIKPVLAKLCAAGYDEGWLLAMLFM